ncbi:alpha/beta hydrolase [Natrarchaeobaculum sulfurireducens]|uniref:Alpha/beta superfamily hydrolase n=1 Tax=Natrarchaeobaculum sulfurireducens TaxID=2044521 RepID=A0A346PIP9_9EURY|nr:alpha/beta fold hydrolase [Natrarchaeobaculum sulfurireducens]AXR79394.1 Alpha/beta superfamily hydrolase [Natrarchaeobaculum sulfurireducens]
MRNDNTPSPSRRTFLAGAAGTAALGTAATGGASNEYDRETPKTVNDGDLTEHDLTMDDGYRLRVWERTAAADPEEAVIFVHGMTYGAVPMFDPPVAPEFGWLPYAAERGQATFAPDMRGYGESDRPPEYDEPPEANIPGLSFEREARDLLAMTHWLRETQGFDRIHYVGLSGGVWRGRAVYTLGDPEYATVTLAGGSFETLEVGVDPDGPFYLPHTRDEFDAALTGELPEEAAVDDWLGGEEYTAQEVLDGVWKPIVESNQRLAEPDTVANPLVLQQATYHPEHVDDPTLVIRASGDGTIDREGALNLYDAVGAAADRKRYVELEGGTHFVFLERRREPFFEEVFRFQQRY